MEEEIMLGIDIIEIKRIEESCKNLNFLERIFTQRELDYYNINGKNAQHLAGFWATKEAVAKALGTGFVGFNYQDIEVLHTDNNQPYVILYNKAKELSLGKRARVSISHCEAYATAVCMFE